VLKISLKITKKTKQYGFWEKVTYTRDANIKGNSGGYLFKPCFCMQILEIQENMREKRL
jgi:hypothetical protein